MHFNLPKNVEIVLSTLCTAGYQSYIVGGCVRDLLCGKAPHDYDVTTSALPADTARLFEKTVQTGIKHGTVTVIIEGEPIEVTTFRTEGSYTDNRRPDRVEFVSRVDDDLARRDFTVNAMCYNPEVGLLDLFGGQADIKNKVLRAVGDAKTRFSEDALRILRLFRFAATLGFGIEPNTYRAALECAPLLKNVSAERIFTELKKAALGDNTAVLNALLESGALKHLDIYGILPEHLALLPKREDLRLFALLQCTSRNLPATLKSIKCSNRFYNYCMTMQTLTLPQNGYEIKKILNRAEAFVLWDFLDLVGGDNEGIKQQTQRIIQNGEPYKISQLDISGNDIAALGFEGKEIGQKLSLLLDCVMKDPTLNKREKLIAIIK